MENRNGYYYRKVWTGGTCHSIYIGQGGDAELLAQQEDEQRLARQAEREALRALVATEQAVDAEIDAIGGALAALADATLLLAGYRQHNRGEWRRKRDKRQ